MTRHSRQHIWCSSYLMLSLMLLQQSSNHYHFATPPAPGLAYALALRPTSTLQRVLGTPLPRTARRSTAPTTQLHAFIPRKAQQSSLSASSTTSTINGSIRNNTDSYSSSSGSGSNSSKQTCFPTATPWEVHKFGGASLANAELYRTVGDLLLREQSRHKQQTGAAAEIPTMAVVSARGGMTDLLVQVVDSALRDFEEASRALQEAVESQIAVLKQLAPESITAPIEASLQADAKDILSVVQSLRMLNTVPAVTMEVVTGFGEIW